MAKVRIALLTVLVSIGVALTYYYFEYVVRHSINYVWYSVLNTNSNRILVVPACIVLAFVFFAAQHYIDPRSEEHEEKGLGSSPKATLKNFFIVIILGFFSLIAGASLGPEAILVPASMIIGGYIGLKFTRKKDNLSKTLGVIAFVALFTAFFNSAIFGILGLLLITKQEKIKLKIDLIILALLSCLFTLFTLSIVNSSPYVKLPKHSWHISFITILAVVILAVAGYLLGYALKYLNKLFNMASGLMKREDWWVKALVASVVLSALYLLGGHLVEFTGNESIVPMLNESASLGFVGLAWIAVIKVIAIGWSKFSGYRGGLIFPSIFVASVFVAIVQSVVKDVSFIYGIIAVVAGLIIANQKLKVLF